MKGGRWVFYFPAKLENWKIGKSQKFPIFKSSIRNIFTSNFSVFCCFSSLFMFNFHHFLFSFFFFSFSLFIMFFLVSLCLCIYLFVVVACVISMIISRFRYLSSFSFVMLFYVCFFVFLFFYYYYMFLLVLNISRIFLLGFVVWVVRKESEWVRLERSNSSWDKFNVSIFVWCLLLFVGGANWMSSQVMKIWNFIYLTIDDITSELS